MQTVAEQLLLDKDTEKVEPVPVNIQDFWEKLGTES